MADHHLKQDQETINTDNATSDLRGNVGLNTDADAEDRANPHQDTRTALAYTEFERLFRSEDGYEQPTTTRRELWSYYLYYNGNASRPLFSQEVGLTLSLDMHRRQWSWPGLIYTGTVGLSEISQPVEGIGLNSSPLSASSGL